MTGSGSQKIEFSVIMPAINEEDLIPASIQYLKRLHPAVEIIVADGGSSDNTRTAAEQAGALVIQSDAGRGTQCNAGAVAATRDILLFLHADTSLPEKAFPVLQQVFSDPAVQIGTFRLVFDWPHPVLRLYEPFSRVDSIFTRFGDQCITVRRSFFSALGGFPNWPLFEDVALLQKARRITRIHSFPAIAITSARRYRENGVVRQQLFNLWLMLLYLGGVSPDRLAAWYRRDRKEKHAVDERISKSDFEIS